MKHPNREQWMSFLYDESTPAERSGLQAHLQVCPDCRAQVAGWRQAGSQLDQWKLPGRRSRPFVPILLKWAAAAAIVGVVTAGGLRMVSLQNEVRQLRAEMHEGWKEKVSVVLTEAAAQAAHAGDAGTQVLIAGVVQRLEEKRLADQQALVSAMQRLSERQDLDFALLRKELETVAVYTENGLQNAQNQIAQMATSPLTAPLTSESDSHE